MKNAVVLLLLLTVFARPTCAASGPTTEAIQWQPWSADIFARAAREHRLVLLDLEAVWCHWCHVMDEQTYHNPEVIQLIRDNYIAVKVDQDSRPDLSNRYEDYGWPATVVFNPAGGEIIKRSGYIPPAQFASILRAIIVDPTPGPSVRNVPELTASTTTFLPPELRDKLRSINVETYDNQHGSWGTPQKFLDWNSVEYAMAQARDGDAHAAQRAQQTLAGELHLIDPAWGGVYQYSVGGDWFEPHFEKIMSMQAGNLRIYALAYAQWHDPAYLKAAQAIQRYLADFLTSPDGAFYTSQDADLIEGQHSADYFKLDAAARSKLGIPRVDKHLYARENGWAIDALATLYSVTGDPQALAQATRAARWIIAHRTLGDGGFRHDEHDAAGPYLGDTLAMGNAFLTLYSVTGERDWLTRARASLAYIDQTFRVAGTPGFVTAKSATDPAYKPQALRDENVVLARFANLLFQYTGDAQYQAMARYAMHYLTIPQVAMRLPVAAVLLADRELGSDPVHVTVVGHRDDPAARALFMTAINSPDAYRRSEWWDKREGSLPNPDVQYPELDTAAAFVCTSHVCSSPIRQPQALAQRLMRTQSSEPGLGSLH
jgi:uncharacterized protein YyaL (SSP411 family)